MPAIEAISTPSLHNLNVEPSEYATAVEKIQKVLPAKAAPDAAEKYLAEKASSAPGFKELVHRTFGDYMREDALKGIRVILSTLE